MKVLLAVDDSEASLHACRLLATYAGDRSALDVKLLNVQRPTSMLGSDGFDPLPQVASPHAGEHQLERARQVLATAGYRLTSVVRVGAPAEILLKSADAGRADLLLLGSGRQGVLAGYAIGSVAMRVAPAAHCSVLLVKPGIAIPASLGITARVTVPVDGSSEATAAVRRLVACARFLGEMHVDLVHFRPGLTLAAAMLPPHDDVLRKWGGQESDAALAEPVQLLAAAGIAHEVHRETGAPDTGIAAFAEARGADLIAMGSRGAGAMHHLFLGSSALRTAHLSGVPVALLR